MLVVCCFSNLWLYVNSDVQQYLICACLDAGIAPVNGLTSVSANMENLKKGWQSCLGMRIQVWYTVSHRHKAPCCQKTPKTLFPQEPRGWREWKETDHNTSKKPVDSASYDKICVSCLVLSTFLHFSITSF